jgi:hypothetical protein
VKITKGDEEKGREQEEVYCFIFPDPHCLENGLSTGTELFVVTEADLKLSLCFTKHNAIHPYQGVKV